MAWSIGRYFYRQMSRRTKERGCTRKMAEHNIVTQNRPVTCGSKNLKRENWVFGAHPFGRKETKTRILFITLDHDPLCSNYFKTLRMINKRKFLSKQQISGQGQRKKQDFFFLESNALFLADWLWHVLAWRGTICFYSFPIWRILYWTESNKDSCYHKTALYWSCLVPQLSPTIRDTFVNSLSSQRSHWKPFKLASGLSIALLIVTELQVIKLGIHRNKFLRYLPQNCQSLHGVAKWIS